MPRINFSPLVWWMATAAIVFGLLALSQCRRAQTARTEAKLATGQAGAALQSGTDAVNAIGNRMEADAEADTLTKENADAIRTAEGANAPVAPAVRDAALAGLCRRAAYRRDPKCVQRADPR